MFDLLVIGAINLKITSLSINGFQSFGPETSIIQLDDCTTFIGENGVGKSAALMALCRMFGTSQPLRDVRADDFHLPAGEKLEDKQHREFFCEVRLDFPELDDVGLNQGSIPPSFNAMVIEAPNQKPYCRMRLIATWTHTPLEQGDVTVRLVWVISSELEPTEESFRNVAPIDRARIQVFYVPGSRDASRQLANASGTLLNQLLKAVKWTDNLKADVRQKAEEVRNAFLQLTPVTLINSTSATYWRELYDDAPFATPSLAFMGSEFDDVLKDTKIVFNPTHGHPNQPLERLSDGQQSLFYFAFINTLFAIRRQVYDDYNAPNLGEDQQSEIAGVEPVTFIPATRITDYISFETLRPAPLTLFAVEEPENHLAPHYLARIIRQLGKIATDDGAQVIVTSHCPAILARVEPENIRYFTLRRPHLTTIVRRLILPDKADEEFKYVKQAVQAYPELYFSRFVILAEGDSEEYLLKKFAQLGNAPLDNAFVSVVPLGGRFVNHLWKLLTDLNIPHITLLDFDQERRNGGWRTIRYALEELAKVLPPDQKDELYTVLDNDVTRLMSEDELENFGDLPIEQSSIDAWAIRLETYGVYLSRPLDIDFLLLQSYTDQYKAVYQGEPRGFNTVNWPERIQKSIATVLGSEGGDGASFTDKQKELFPWYSYLFLGKGKPSTHALAWLSVDNIAHEDLPQPLNRLFAKVIEQIKVIEEE